MKDFNIDEYREKQRKRKYHRQYYRNKVQLNPRVVRYESKSKKENRKNFSIKRPTLLPTEQKGDQKKSTGEIQNENA
tara:strand:- start:26 stop:256 length:231 start_codon:yes stop_codon:yes gene_type:complete